MNWKGCERKQPCANVRYYTGICLEQLQKTAKNLRQVCQSPGRDLNPVTSEQEAGVSATQPRRFVLWNQRC
jgi:hypothetical protein